MNKSEFDRYSAHSKPDPTIGIGDPGIGVEARTLVYGYTLDRDSFHVYIMDKQIHRLIYRYDGEILAHESSYRFLAHDLRPSKRAYPDATDFYFAMLIRERDAELTFLGNFDWESSVLRAERAPFYGKTHIELEASSDILPANRNRS